MKVEYKNKVINLPDFLIVGAQKSATTTLYKNLQLNSKIFMPNIKELNFFAYNHNDKEIKFYKNLDLGPNFMFVTDEDDYFKLFNNNSDDCCGECSINYLNRYKKTIKKIKKIYGNQYSKLKIIISLRNPIERSFSHWMMNARDEIEKYNFEKAVSQNIDDGVPTQEYRNYIGNSLYSDSVKYFIENFDNVHVLYYDDISNNLLNEINKILEFLNLDKISNINNTKYNVSGIPNNKMIYNLVFKNYLFKNTMKKLISGRIKDYIKNKVRNSMIKDNIDIEIKTKLKQYFLNDIQILSDLLKKDLVEMWLK